MCVCIYIVCVCVRVYIHTHNLSAIKDEDYAVSTLQSRQYMLLLCINFNPIASSLIPFTTYIYVYLCIYVCVYVCMCAYV